MESAPKTSDDRASSTLIWCKTLVLTTNKRMKSQGRIDTWKSMLKDPKSLALGGFIVPMQVSAAKRST